jgi:hypothetical protein
MVRNLRLLLGRVAAGRTRPWASALIVIVTAAGAIAQVPAVLANTWSARSAAPRLLTCVDSENEPAADAFPESVLRRSSKGAEKANSPAAAALRTFLATTTTGRALPSSDYQMLVNGPGLVVFAHSPGPSGSYVAVSNAHGAWSATSAGGCWPHRVRSDRLVASFSALAARPGPRTRVLRLLVEPPGCEITPAFSGAQLTWRRHRVTVTLLLKKAKAAGPLPVGTAPPGSAPTACSESGRRVEYRVELPHALGDRVVFDGSRVPAARVR